MRWRKLMSFVASFCNCISRIFFSTFGFVAGTSSFFFSTTSAAFFTGTGLAGVALATAVFSKTGFVTGALKAVGVFKAVGALSVVGALVGASLGFSAAMRDGFSAGVVVFLFGATATAAILDELTLAGLTLDWLLTFAGELVLTVVAGLLVVGGFFLLTPVAVFAELTFADPALATTGFSTFLLDFLVATSGLALAVVLVATAGVFLAAEFGFPFFVEREIA